MRPSVTLLVILVFAWRVPAETSYDPRCKKSLPEKCDSKADLEQFLVSDVTGQCVFTKMTIGNISISDPNWPYYFKVLECMKRAGLSASDVPWAHQGMIDIVERTTMQRECSGVRHACRSWDCDRAIPAGHCWRDGEACFAFLVELDTDLKPSGCWKNVLQVDKRQMLKDHTNPIYRYIALCGAPDMAFRRRLGYEAEEKGLKVVGMKAVTTFCQNVDKWILRFGNPLTASDTTTLMDLNVIMFHFVVFLVGSLTMLHGYWAAVRVLNWTREKLDMIRQQSRAHWNQKIKIFVEKHEAEKKKRAQAQQPHQKAQMEDCDRMPGASAPSAPVDPKSKSKNTKSKLSKSKTTTKKSGLKKRRIPRVKRSKASKTTTGKKTSTGKKGKKSKSKTSKSKASKYIRPKTKAQIIRETREKAQAILDKRAARKKSGEQKSKDKAVEQKHLVVDVVEEQKTQESEVVSVEKEGNKRAGERKTQQKVAKDDTGREENTQASEKVGPVKEIQKNKGKGKATSKNGKDTLSEKTARDSVKAHGKIKKEMKAVAKNKPTDRLSEKTCVDSEVERKTKVTKDKGVKAQAPNKTTGEPSERTCVESDAERKEFKKPETNVPMKKEPTKTRTGDVLSEKSCVESATEKKGTNVNMEKAHSKKRTSKASAEKAASKPQSPNAQSKAAKHINKEKSSAERRDEPKRKEFLSEKTAQNSEAPKKTTEGTKPVVMKPKNKDNTTGEKRAVENKHKQQEAAPKGKGQSSQAVGPKPKKDAKSVKKEDVVLKDTKPLEHKKADEKAQATKATMKKGDAPKK